MTTITLESIKSEHAKIGDLIAAFEKQQETAALFFPEVTINLAPGEHYAGHQINANDIKYVRADIAEAELEAAMAEIELERTSRQQTERLLHKQAETIAAQQARIEELHHALSMPCDRWNKTQHKIVSKALSTPDDLSALRAHDAATWREAMQIAEDSRDKATMSKYSSVPECRAARDMAECLSKAYCHKADAIEKGGDK